MTHAVESGSVPPVDRLHRAKRRQRRQRARVAVRDGRKRRRRARHQRLHKPVLGHVHHRHVEQQEPAARVRALRIGRGSRRRPQECGAIDGGRRLKLLVEALEKVRQIVADVREPPQRRRQHRRQGQLLERARQGAREPRHRRDRREVGQRLVAIGVEQRARGHRLHAEARRLRQAVPREQRRREPRGQLRQAETILPEGGPARATELTREVVGRAARRGDDQDFCGGGRLEDEPARGVEPSRGGCRGNDAQVRTPSGRHAGYSVNAAQRRVGDAKGRTKNDAFQAGTRSAGDNINPGSSCDPQSSRADAQPSRRRFYIVMRGTCRAESFEKSEAQQTLRLTRP